MDSTRRAAPPEAPLPDPCRYTPFAGGVYEVSAGLRPLGTPFGHGPRDAHRFQVGRTFPHYRAVKLRSRSTALDRYAPAPAPSDGERRALAPASGSTSAAALEYKGLARSRGAVLSWLRSLDS
jgi:hypothetical protein